VQCKKNNEQRRVSTLIKSDRQTKTLLYTFEINKPKNNAKFIPSLQQHQQCGLFRGDRNDCLEHVDKETIFLNFFGCLFHTPSF